MKTILFAYGVLMYPPAVKGLTGRQFRAEAAILPGYRRYALKKIGFPRIAGILPAADHDAVPGMVLYDLDDRSMKIFDLFEGVHAALYRRYTVQVQCGERQVKADAYVIDKRAQRYIAGDWDQAEFERRYMKRYCYSVIPKFVRRCGLQQGTRY